MALQRPSSFDGERLSRIRKYEIECDGYAERAHEAIRCLSLKKRETVVRLDADAERMCRLITANVEQMKLQADITFGVLLGRIETLLGHITDTKTKLGRLITRTTTDMDNATLETDATRMPNDSNVDATLMEELMAESPNKLFDSILFYDVLPNTTFQRMANILDSNQSFYYLKSRPLNPADIHLRLITNTNHVGNDVKLQIEPTKSDSEFTKLLGIEVLRENDGLLVCHKTSAFNQNNVEGVALSFSTQRSGDYKVLATIYGEHVLGSPLTVHVDEAPEVTYQMATLADSLAAVAEITITDCCYDDTTTVLPPSRENDDCEPPPIIIQSGPAASPAVEETKPTSYRVRRGLLSNYGKRPVTKNTSRANCDYMQSELITDAVGTANNQWDNVLRISSNNDTVVANGTTPVLAVGGKETDSFGFGLSLNSLPDLKHMLNTGSRRGLRGRLVHMWGQVNATNRTPADFGKKHKSTTDGWETLMDSPLGVWRSEQTDEWMVCDTNNETVKVFDHEFKPSRAFKNSMMWDLKEKKLVPASFRNPSNVVVFNDGKLSVVKDDRSLSVFSNEVNSHYQYPIMFGQGIRGMTVTGSYAVTIDAALHASMRMAEIKIFNLNTYRNCGISTPVKCFNWVNYCGKLQLDKSEPRFMDALGTMLAVTDLGLDKVFLVNLESGQLRNVIGQRGHREGQFSFVSGIRFDGGGNLIIADAKNSRVQLFDGATGAFLCKLQLEAPMGASSAAAFVSDIHLTIDGHLMVASRGSHYCAIYKLEPI